MLFIDDKIKARFWDKVFKDGIDECWLWLASVDSSGYGIFKIEGKLWKAHRFSYLLHFDKINNLLVCHHCDEPRCVNPKHLFLGTHADNSRDRDDKKRSCLPYQIGHEYRGGGGRPKLLTHFEIEEIREKYHRGCYTQKELAKEYSVGVTVIWSIINRKRGY